jgi:hypothetical protein
VSRVAGSPARRRWRPVDRPVRGRSLGKLAIGDLCCGRFAPAPRGVGSSERASRPGPARLVPPPRSRSQTRRALLRGPNVVASVLARRSDMDFMLSGPNLPADLRFGVFEQSAARCGVRFGPRIVPTPSLSSYFLRKKLDGFRTLFRPV